LTALSSPQSTINPDPLNFSRCGLQTLRAALEGFWSTQPAAMDSEEVTEVNVNADPPVQGTFPPSFILHSAATWFLYSADPLYLLCLEETPVPGDLGKAGFSFEGRGQNGINLNRWHFWKIRLEVAFNGLTSAVQRKDSLGESEGELLEAARAIGHALE
jgi:hypothetical protein